MVVVLAVSVCEAAEEVLLLTINSRDIEKLQVTTVEEVPNSLLSIGTFLYEEKVYNALSVEKSEMDVCSKTRIPWTCRCWHRNTVCASWAKGAS